MGYAEQFLSKMADADTFGSGQYFEDGSYEVEVMSLKLRTGGFKGDFFIAEFKIIESNQPKDPVGAVRSQTIKMDPAKMGNAMSDIKNLGFALLGYNPKTVGKPTDPQWKPLHDQVAEIVKCVVDAEYCKNSQYARANGVTPNVFDGSRVRLDTHKKPTQKGGLFTVHNYSPTAAAAAARG